ncbi:hypothetical protein D9758_013709 [Tetrapyrgos nigripes]|uniref:HAT C-terminal dimerisation domain-containing protein n=1 Tax=Tetrapyrgos nigripes TaxID=182062 RepID=A0A8H5CTP4_9AGAR|nr:hypothetical protein D9758_014874 [Tetrapyrgos nigripes]KAF5356706.1 hypothetical protein D9758_013709 [Tetrapyrgos nigripes]
MDKMAASVIHSSKKLTQGRFRKDPSASSIVKNINQWLFYNVLPVFSLILLLGTGLSVTQWVSPTFLSTVNSSQSSLSMIAFSAAQTSPQDELDKYFHFTSHPSKMTVDPLEWWHARRDQFPNLYCLACDVLCIPGKFSSIIAGQILISFYLGSAVAIERVFSGGRDTISLRRSSLKADTIQALMVVKAQLKMARIAITEVLGND